MQRNIELLIVMVATLAPFWITASSWADGSEAKATGWSVAAGAAVIGTYRMWLKRGRQ